MQPYQYVIRGKDGQTLRATGTAGTIEEAHERAKYGQWVLSYPLQVWAKQGAEPDLTAEPGIIEDPAYIPKPNAQIEGADPTPEQPPVEPKAKKPRKPRAKKS